MSCCLRRLDIDWEYPGVQDRGGNDADRTNFGLLFQEFRAAIAASGKPFLLTLATGAGPTGYSGKCCKLHFGCDRVMPDAP